MCLEGTVSCLPALNYAIGLSLRNGNPFLPIIPFKWIIDVYLQPISNLAKQISGNHKVNRIPQGKCKKMFEV